MKARNTQKLEKQESKNILKDLNKNMKIDQIRFLKLVKKYENIEFNNFLKAGINYWSKIINGKIYMSEEYFLKYYYVMSKDEKLENYSYEKFKEDFLKFCNELPYVLNYKFENDLLIGDLSNFGIKNINDYKNKIITKKPNIIKDINTDRVLYNLSIFDECFYNWIDDDNPTLICPTCVFRINKNNLLNYNIDFSSTYKINTDNL
jgi:hypothetical protein